MAARFARIARGISRVDGDQCPIGPRVRGMRCNTEGTAAGLRMDPHSSLPTSFADALLPPQMAERAETAGVLKTRLDTVSLVSLAVLAGAFIGLGAMNAIVVSAGAAGVLPYGLTQLLKGAAFSVGLMLVVVGGAELFTGNNLMVMAWASRRVTGRELLRAWG